MANVLQCFGLSLVKKSVFLKDSADAADAL